MSLSIRSTITTLALSCAFYSSSLAFDLGDGFLTMPGFLIISNFSGRDILVDTTEYNYTISAGQIMHVKIEEPFSINHLELGTASDIKDAFAVAGKKLSRCHTISSEGFEKDLQSVTFNNSSYGYLTMIATNSTPEGVTCAFNAISRDSIEEVFDDI